MDTHRTERPQAQADSVRSRRKFRVLHDFFDPNAEQIERKRHAIRIKRAVALVARTRCDCNVAARACGLYGDADFAEVREACDDSNVLRRRAAGRPLVPPHTQEPMPVIVKPERREPVIVRLPNPVSPRPPARKTNNDLRKSTFQRVAAWRRRNRQRQAALSAVARAIADFDLEREACERCGTGDNVCADPISLDPLRVRWRCRSCSYRQRAARLDVDER